MSEQVTPPFRQMFLEMGGESERAAVLLCGAMLDRSLEHLLREHFKQSNDVDDGDVDFFLKKQPLPPLGGFSIKARAAHLLGLIDRSLSKSIQAFAKIRNSFAHKETPEALTIDSLKPVYAGIPSDIKEGFQRLADDSPAAARDPIRTSLVAATAMIDMALSRSLTIVNFPNGHNHGHAEHPEE